jgi:hypothetical protein
MAQKQHSTLTQTTQGLRCRYCASDAVSLSVTHKVYPTKNLRVIVAKVTCEHCHHVVTIAKVNGGASLPSAPSVAAGRL